MIESFSNDILQLPLSILLAVLFSLIAFLALVSAILLSSVENARGEKDLYKDEIRAVTLFTTVASILFLALEARNENLSNQAEEAVDRVLDEIPIQMSVPDSDLLRICNMPAGKAVEAIESKNWTNDHLVYCAEHTKRRETLEGIDEESVQDHASLLPILTQRADYQNPVATFEDAFLDANNRLRELFKNVEDALKNNNPVPTWLTILFVLVLAAGAGLEIGSEARARINKVALQVKARRK